MAEAGANSTCGPAPVIPHADGWAFAIEVIELLWVRAPGVVEDAFVEQAEVCASLGTRRARRLAYQVLVRPDPQHPALGRIELNLVGWAGSEADAREFCDDLADLLVSLDHLATFRVVQSANQLQCILNPFAVHHFAEVRQRDMRLTGDDLQPGDTDSHSGDRYFLVTMVQPSPDDLKSLCERLLYQEAPVVIRVSIVPTELTPQERDGVWAPLRAEGDSTLARFIRRLDGGLDRLQAFANLYPTFDIQVLIGSPEPLSETLLTTIATPISQGGRSGGALLAGQPEVVALAEVPEEAQIAFDSIRPTALVPTSAENALARLHRIVGPSQLACFLRFPIATGPQFPGLSVQASRTVEAPIQALAHEGAVIGTGRAQGQPIDISWPRGDRGRHLYVVGQTGTGKSTLLEQMILQDAEAGRGVAVLDPHGDLIERLLERLPEARLGDVVLFDPGDADYCLGLSPLTAETDAQRDFIVQDLGEMFYALYDPERSGIVGPRFESWLRMAALTLIDSTGAGPALLEDIPRLFSDDEFLKQRFSLCQ
ncbi:MAG: type IV secretion system DNA-binding domain-containing protein [Acidimicrobiia bacterium]